MGDGTSKIFLCAEGSKDDVSEELKAFLQYIAGGSPCTDTTRKLEKLVEEAREHKNWRLEYMTLLERDEIMRQEGYEAGRKEVAKKVAKKRCGIQI